MDQIKAFRPILTVFAVSLGFVLLMAGDEIEQGAAAMHPEPETISCRDLIDSGPPANRHICITDIWFGEGWYYEEKHGSPEWDCAFVPAYPRDVTDGGEGENIRLIVRVSNIRGEADVLAALEREKFTAQVWKNQVIPPDCQNILRGFYPRIDFDKCGVIRVGEPLPTFEKARNYRLRAWYAWGLAVLLTAWWLADRSAVRLGLKLDAAAVDPYAWQSNGEDGPADWSRPSVVGALCTRTVSGMIGFCVASMAILLALTRLGAIPSEAGYLGHALSVGGLLFASSLLGRRYTEIVREPVEPGQLPRKARKYFEHHTPELERLGFRYVGDVQSVWHSTTHTRRFLSDDGLILAELGSGKVDAFSFDSLAADGTYLHTLSVNLSRLLDESLPMRTQLAIGMSVTQACRAHQEFIRRYRAGSGASLLTIEPEDISVMSDYCHRIMSWSMFRNGIIKLPPPPLPRFTSMAELKAPRRAVLV